ncbi:hypothetical protein MPL3356_70352 [Mesorhizobium plurifarium]|uniref:Uncharacterized protein n=1 Tax=Mesorhizobium plurifarium TaxID=69974 RepID=A0A090GD22_MESPL|nr:hypothetical protein MPL3356_70352 [Mesorhizobium plurifarium]CDX62441.1 hypothetical protein MPL3365_70469 [Mesorhizobium plurifarium]
MVASCSSAESLSDEMYIVAEYGALSVPRRSWLLEAVVRALAADRRFAGASLALAPAALEADDAVSRTIQPMRAFRAAMAVRAQPARANENLLGPVTAGAFLRTHQFLPRRDAMFRFNDRVHPFSPQRLDYRSDMLIHYSLH